MKILVANLGSTSFKYKLFDMPAGAVLASGSMDRIGDGSGSVHKYRIGADEEAEQSCSLPDPASAIDEALRRLVGEGGDDSSGILASLADLAAVGF